MEKTISINELHSFIKNNLPEKLKSDLVEFRILNESDISSCAYFHLRNFINKDKR